jgi:hypothetical protein
MLVQNLESLLIADGSFEELEAFLVAGSNLPGPRGNLELAWAFAGCFDRIEMRSSLWQLLHGWIGISEESAPTGDPREFLPFCALLALGSAHQGASGARQHQIVESLKTAARDGRWRMREAVAMAFQRLGERDFQTLKDIFSTWMERATLQEQRAVVATLAHPPMLKKPDNVMYSLTVGDKVLSNLVSLNRDARKSEGFRVLRQGLEYALSVFVAPLPTEGFAFLKRWATVDDADIKRILKSNVSKNRLTKKYPAEVEEILALLQTAFHPRPGDGE